jgi:hypothetical protein
VDGGRRNGDPTSVITLLGTDELPAIVRALSVERVIIAFSQDASRDDRADSLAADVQVQSTSFHGSLRRLVKSTSTLEGVPLLALPPAVLALPRA